MNYIHIIEPRWHDKTVLVADWKIGSVNQIKIDHKDYPQPFYATGHTLKNYPLQDVITKKGDTAPMRVIPIADLSTDLVLNEL